MDINNCHTVFFESIGFTGDLTIRVTEGKKASDPEKINIGGISLGEGYRVNSGVNSVKFDIVFQNPVAWQVVDESYTSSDPVEEFERSGILSVLTASKYLDYINESHGFYRNIIGPGKHYRIWTEDQVIDVISLKEPSVVAK